MLLTFVAATVIAAAGPPLEEDQLSKEFARRAIARTARPSDGLGKSNSARGLLRAHSLPGVDSIVAFSDQFVTPGFDDAGNPKSVWPYSMVGQRPEANRTTAFNAPVVPVNVELLDFDGNVRYVNGAPLRQTVGSDVVRGTVKSPIFQDFTYTSGRGQFTDEMMRAQFWDRIRHKGDDEDDDGGYHNVLQPSVKKTRTMQLPRGKYQFALNDDGSCCFFVLADADTFVNKLFPATEGDPSAVIGAAQKDGDVRTRDISTFLFNGVYLYIGSPSNCCILGFHSYDFEPGDAANGFREKRFVMNYSSWVPNDAFLGFFEDVTTLSHEMAETFDDPFVDNATPWWLTVDPFTGAALCQNNLETGDVVEVLTANLTFAASLNNRTYHLQNEALLPWFAFQSPSAARLGAYTFPDETTLKTLSPSALKPGCVP